MNEKNMQHEPIAIIGIGCRFPGGASNPKAFWELLCQGTDAITEVPPERWDTRQFYDPDPEKPGKTYVKQGGFLREDISNFDSLFFGISPREAQVMDPQQCLLLEVTWEAFEDAGLAAEKLAGSETGVFIGAFTMDILMETFLKHQRINTFHATGCSMTLLANRLSYVFDLKGPSVALDTACSSSLVATHYACQSLWNGECTLAVAGGVNVMWRPEHFIQMSKGRFLSPSGRCRAFDERADGYVRGEGAGVVMLKPLSAALRDKDNMYALIRATGCNQDGKTPGIPFPCQESQEQLIFKVSQQAGISPGEVHYVEAHGTGTKVGDPVEANALQRVFSHGRKPEQKCLMGSVKTNIGHLEAAAGIAGLIKTALCLKHQAIPPNLHFEQPNVDIPFHEMCLHVPTALIPWPPGNRPAYAGVNSFGYGGTNAHVLLQEAPKDCRLMIDDCRLGGVVNQKPTINNPMLFPISARSEHALTDLAQKYDEFLAGDGNGILLKDLCYSASMRRSHHAFRAAVVTETREQLSEQLQNFAAGARQFGLSSNQILPHNERRVVFVYTGMGPQWWAMGRELMEKEPVFRESVEECDAVFSSYANWSLLEVFSVPEHESRITETQVAQPANFALQAALTALWKSWGISPDAVVGHSVGEVTAAYISGALALEDALRVSYHRSRLQQTRAGKGMMLAVDLTEEKAQELIRNSSEAVSIAAINSLSFVTLSGEPECLQDIAHILEQRNVFHRFLRVEVAYHSYQMDPLREELLSVLSGIDPKDTRIPFYSTVTGTQIQGAELHAAYWWNNVRQPVRFAGTMEAMIADHYPVFLEVGPHPVLQNAINKSFQTAKSGGHHISSLHRKKPELAKMLESLGYFYTLGFQVNREIVMPQEGRYIALPTYPWQKNSSCQEVERSQEDRGGSSEHVFMHKNLGLPSPAWEVELNNAFFPYLDDHRIDDNIVFPGAAYVEAGLAIHKKLFPQHVPILEQVEFHKFLVIDKKAVQILHLAFQPQTRSYSVYSRFEKEDSEWTRHAGGKILTVNAPVLPPVDITAIQQRCPKEISIEGFYENLKTSTFHFGHYFKVFHKLWSGSHEALGKIQGHESLAANPDRYILHPTILDAGFQLCILLMNSPESRTWIPVSIERVTLYTPPARECWAYSRIIEQTEDTLRGNIFILNEDGHVAVEIKGACLKVFETRERPQEVLHHGLYAFRWQRAENRENNELQFAGEKSLSAIQAENWLVLGEAGDIIAPLLEQLEAHNIRCTLVSSGDSYKKTDTRHYHMQPDNRDDMRQICNDLKDDTFSTILYLRSLVESSAESSEVFADAVGHCVTLQHLLQELPQVKAKEHLTLAIVTRGCQSIHPGDSMTTGLTSMPLWGLGRVIRMEYPDILCQLIDLDQNPNDHNRARLAKLLLAKTPEVEIALRADEVFVNRLEHISLPEDPNKGKIRQTSTTAPVELVIDVPGSMESLMYCESERSAPGSGEIEIKVHTAALNFKDILKVMGVIPANVIEDTYFGNSFGMECSGRVVAVGDDVTAFKVGDEVIAATGAGCFRSYVTAPTTYVISKPKTLGMEEAPIFTVFLTAYYALTHVARLEKGERVLIHNAAGGVGLAAVRIAQWLGAEMFVTAGTPEKREFLKSLGIQYVMDSRTLKFADDVEQWTNGRGVDVVLNAMSGEALQKSFNLLAPYGRFVEIGKKDIAENSGLAMGAFNRNATFRAIDLDRIFEDRVRLGRQLFREVYQGFEEGRLHALPVTVFPAAEAEQAFRYLAQSKHIGKVMIAMEDQNLSVVPAPRQFRMIKEDGTYLITGGTRGFGFEIAKWLVSKGARHLVLIGRSGVLSDETQQAIAIMEDQGTRIVTQAVDVSDEQQVQQLFETINASLPPLRGIFHGAMVLQDGLLNGLDEGSFAKVMAPKILGALHLHQYSQHQPLDLFVLLSSVSSATGNIGQANYAAANAFLDGFAYYRRSLGLPATTINWGALSEVGVAARDEKVRQLLEKSGIIGINIEQALHALDVLSDHNPLQMTVALIDWEKWSGVLPQTAISPIFQQLIRKKTSGRDSEKMGKRQELLRTLAGLDLKARQEFLQSLLVEKLANALQLPAAKIDRQQNMLDFGVDSLIAAEISNSFHSQYGLELSTMDFFQGVSITRMAARLLEKIAPEFDSMGEDSEETAAALLSKEKTMLSEQEAAQIQRDIALDPAIRPMGKILPRIDPEVVLLTGATGFLGAHLLHDLARFTQARIYCLVRAQNGAEARERLDRNLAKYFDSFRTTERIIPLAGDLAEPLLGLSGEEFARIAAELDTIYHNGASVNHLYPYERLRAANVSSAKEILKLAATIRPKRIHYISSLIAAAGRDTHKSFLEQFVGPNLPEILQGYGYGQTKWVSEKLLVEAAQRGFDVRIFRPGFISGRSDTGAWPVSQDHLLRMIKGCIQMGSAHDLDFPLDMTPVDFLSEAIVKMSLCDGIPGDVFNLSNPHTFTWNELIRWITGYGYSMTVISMDAWRKKYLPQINKENALFPLLPFYKDDAHVHRLEWSIFNANEGNIERNNTLSTLEALNMAYPPVDAELWRRYFQFFEQNGFIPAPQAS